MSETKYEITIHGGVFNVLPNATHVEQNIYGGTVSNGGLPVVEGEASPVADGAVAEAAGASSDAVADEGAVLGLLVPFFYNDGAEAAAFLRRVRGAKPVMVMEVVNELLAARKISDVSCRKPLWEVLHDNGLYKPSLQNWCGQLK